MMDSEYTAIIMDLDMLGRDARRGDAEFNTLLPYRTEDVRDLMQRATSAMQELLHETSAMQELLKARQDYLSKLDTIINALTTNSK